MLVVVCVICFIDVGVWLWCLIGAWVVCVWWCGSLGGRVWGYGMVYLGGVEGGGVAVASQSTVSPSPTVPPSASVHPAASAAPAASSTWSSPPTARSIRSAVRGWGLGGLSVVCGGGGCSCCVCLSEGRNFLMSVGCLIPVCVFLG